MDTTIYSASWYLWRNSWSRHPLSTADFPNKPSTQDPNFSMVRLTAEADTKKNLQSPGNGGKSWALIVVLLTLFALCTPCPASEL